MVDIGATNLATVQQITTPQGARSGAEPRVQENTITGTGNDDATSLQAQSAQLTVQTRLSSPGVQARLATNPLVQLNQQSQEFLQEQTSATDVPTSAEELQEATVEELVGQPNEVLVEEQEEFVEAQTEEALNTQAETNEAPLGAVIDDSGFATVEAFDEGAASATGNFEFQENGLVEVSRQLLQESLEASLQAQEQANVEANETQLQVDVASVEDNASAGVPEGVSTQFQAFIEAGLLSEQPAENQVDFTA